MVCYSRYAINFDDTIMWLDIYNKKSIWNGYIPNIGRFFPLASIDLNILMQFSSSPYLFTIFNSFLVLYIVIINLKLLNIVNTNKNINYIIITFLMLSFGFVTVMFGICYPERLLSFALSLFILCSYLVYFKESKISIIIGLLALNISLYLKEPVFISTFIIGLFFLYASIKKYSFYLRIYSILILISSIAYIIIYYFLIYINIVDVYGQYHGNYDAFIVKIKGLLNYGLNDSLILFLLTSIIFYRIYLIFSKKDSVNLFFDAFLLSSFLYLVSYLILGLFTQYYLLPCYILSMLSMTYYLINRKYLKLLFIKIVFYLSLFLFIFSSITNGIYYISYFKSNGVEFHNTLTFISNYIKVNGKTNLYFDGIGRGTEKYGVWYLIYSYKSLNILYDTYNFDILTYEDNGKDFSLDIKSPYTFYNSLYVNNPKKGDLIILSHATNKFASKDYINTFKAKYELLYKTNVINIPYMHPKALIKHFGNMLFNNNLLYDDKNPFRLPTDTYIFKVI